MSAREHEPHDLLTVQEAAQLLRLSDDSIRRQIKEGALPAIKVRTTPTGRAQYRIPSQAVSRILGTSALETLPAIDDLFAPLRDAFASLPEADQQELIARAVTWARERRTDEPQARLPALSKAELRQHFAHNRLLHSETP